LNLEIYIAGGPCYASPRYASFATLFRLLDGFTINLRSLKIDYNHGPDSLPRSWLGNCSPVASFMTFPRLSSLTVLQQVLNSCNYSRSIIYEADIAAVLPVAVGSLAIVCLADLILFWLEDLRIVRFCGEVMLLREVALFCRCSYGGSPATFETAAAHALFDKLLALGIHVKTAQETPGAFEREARKKGSVWEAEWAENGDWTEKMFDGLSIRA
jgi:hypothetical protein